MNFFKNNYVFLIFIIIIGLVIRLDFLIASNFQIDADEAIVGLMAKHYLEGATMPVFYYGQHYMGSLEAFLAAFSFKVFGINNFALKLVPLLFSILLIPLTYLITKEFTNEWTAKISSLLMGVCPSTLIIWSAKARGGFIEVVFLGALAMLICVKFLKQDKVNYKTFVLLGLIFGFAWWVNFQVLYFIFPIGLFTFLKLLSLRARMTQILLAIVVGKISFIIGSLPFWIHNFYNKFASFEMFTSAKDKDLLLHWTGFFDSALPILLGGKRFWHDNDLFFGSSYLILISYFILFFIIIWFRRIEYTKIIKLNISKENFIELLVLFLIFSFLVFITSSFGYLVKAPRYLLPTYIGIFILTACAINIIKSKSKMLANSIISFLILFNLASCYLGTRAVQGEPFVYKQERVSKNHRELISWLEKNNFNWVRTNYWIGYRLAFETKEKVKFSVFGEPREARIEKYKEELKDYNLDYLPLVLVPKQAETVKLALGVLGRNYQEIALSGYIVIYNISAKYNNEELKEVSNQYITTSSNYNNENSHLAVDDNLQTRWGSASPQNPTMYFKIKFHTAQRVARIKYFFSNWRHDFPNKLGIYGVNTEGKKIEILNSDGFDAINYFMEGDYLIDINKTDLQEIVFTQEGQHPILDWSIPELKIYTLNQ